MRTKLLTFVGALTVTAGLVILFTSGGQNLSARHGDVDSGTAETQSCDGKICPPGACAALSWRNSGSQFSDVEQKLIDHFCDRIAATGQVQFEIDEVARATGISVDVLEGVTFAKLQPAILSELNRRKIDLSSVAGANCGNCSRFSACSVNRDLNGATGEELTRYEKEKAEDGATFKNWQAPDFTLPTTNGNTITLSDYKDRPVVVTFLAGHCSHSLDTLPILAELKQKYEPLGLSILPVYVNSGSVDNVRTWSDEMNLGCPLIVSQGKDVSEAYDSWLVPSTFLIDSDGRITRKYVGYKSKEALDDAFAALLGKEAETAKL
jgi:cytochrome c biogenesis protein CcmG/thiol:disulfide interchange protein DsbE